MEGSSDIDWDHPASWDAEVAVEAITRLCATRSAPVPVYDLSLSARTGEDTLDIGRTPLFIAEASSPRRSSDAAGSWGCSRTRSA